MEYDPSIDIATMSLDVGTGEVKIQNATGMTKML